MIDRVVLRIPSVVGARTGGESYHTTIRRRGFSVIVRGYETPWAMIKLQRVRLLEDVKVEANLPKILLGHNVTPLGITQLRDAAALLRSHVEATLDVSLPPVVRWQVISVEYHYDWVVGDPSCYVIQAYGAAHQRTGLKRHLMGTSGRSGYTFAFGSKTKGGRVYDKAAEVKVATARKRAVISSDVEQLRRLSEGRLRFEVVASQSEIAGWLERETVDFGDVLDDLGEDPNGYIATNWRNLIPTWESTAYAAAATRLKRIYAPSRALSLLSAWVHITEHGLEQYKRATDVHRSSIKRTLDGLAAAEVLPGTVQLLEPLEIHRLYADW